MAHFSTEFPIDSKNTVEEVMRLACEWIAGSPHTKTQRSDLLDLPKEGERIVTIGDEQVSLARAGGRDFEIGGLHYVRTEEGLQWTTAIVTFKTHEKQTLSIRTVCEALSTAARLPPPKKPYFIRQALNQLGGGTDGEIPVTDCPFRLGEDEAQVAADLILGTANNSLPIVYISTGFRGGHLIDPDELAKSVSGTAHVVVEPSRTFSIKVKGLTGARNVFGGTVGVYWPNSQSRKAYFLDDETPDPRALQFEVARDIRIALSNRRLATPCTWSNLKEAVARNRLDQLKSAGSTELRAYIEAFDADLAAKEARAKEAEEEVSRLSSENRRLSVASQSSADGLIQRGNEQDLYQHEIADIIIEALREASRIAREGSRRQHVLHDLIAANLTSGAGQALGNEIKTLLKTYQEMDAKTRNALGRLGFDLTDDGKHYKAVFQGDGRYTFSFSKTSSDHRTGKNLASDINNKLF
ncbi:hypothetical protein ACOTJG_21605 [Achromobacter xylosoxidans]|jgi:hypothetical protein